MIYSQFSVVYFVALLVYGLYWADGRWVNTYMEH